MIHESIVSDIVSFQFQDARKALHQHPEVEISGYGKFVFSQSKGKKELVRLQTILGRLRQKEPTEKITRQILSIEEELLFIRSKLPDEPSETNCGGLAQQAVPAGDLETTH